MAEISVFQYFKIFRVWVCIVLQFGTRHISEIYTVRYVLHWAHVLSYYTYITYLLRKTYHSVHINHQIPKLECFALVTPVSNCSLTCNRTANCHWFSLWYHFRSLGNRHPILWKQHLCHTNRSVVEASSLLENSVKALPADVFLLALLGKQQARY